MTDDSKQPNESRIVCTHHQKHPQDFAYPFCTCSASYNSGNVDPKRPEGEAREVQRWIWAANGMWPRPKGWDGQSHVHEKDYAALRAENERLRELVNAKGHEISDRLNEITDLRANLASAEADSRRLDKLIDILTHAKDAAWSVRNFIRGCTRKEINSSLDAAIPIAAGEEA